MNAIASAPGARRLFVISLVARLPLAMLSIGLLVHAERLTDSFAGAGIVTGAYAVALGVGGPLLGTVVDRRGQTAVLVASAFASAILLGAVALLPVGTPLAVLVGLAVAIGAATPPVGASLRTVLPRLLPDLAAVRAAYTLDASASELAWILGPPLILGLGAVCSTGIALAAAGSILAAATAAFAAQAASRAWRPTHTGQRPRGGALRTPAMRTLVTVLVGVGVLFGAVEVAVTAAAETLGHTTAAGPLLALWGAGSLVGGMLVMRLGAHQGLTPMLVALTLGHGLLTAATGTLLGLAAVLLVAGAAIAPTYAIVYAMVGEAAPAGTATEAFAWLATAVGIGAAAGAAVAGSLVEQAGPAAAFALAGAAGAVALLAALVRSTTLAGPAAAEPAIA